MTRRSSPSPRCFNRRKVLAGASVGVGTTLLPKQVSAFWHRSDGLERLPLDGNLLNVRDFGATGDGTTDDSAAILAAVAALPMYTFPHKLITQIIYFPVGTYLVSDTIQRIVGTVFYANVPIIGEDRNGTIIKLADNATGFTSSGSPKAVIALHSGNLLGQSNPVTGGGNEGFNNTVEN
jgi:hypothetical protein